MHTFSSVTQSCPTLCDHMDCSMPGLPVPHHLPKFAQVHVCCFSDAIQPSHFLTPSSPLTSIFPRIRDFPVSQLFTSDDQNTGVSASVLPMNIQGLSPLRLTCLISLCSRDFQESSPEPQFEGIILWHSAFLKFQLSQLYMTTGMNVIYYSFKQTQCRL